jgi:hypothetical protein
LARYRKNLVILLMIAVVGAVSWRYGGRIASHVGFLLLQHRCIRQVDTTNLPIYVELDGDIPEIARLSGHLKSFPYEDRGVTRLGRSVGDWLALRDRTNPTAEFEPEGTLFVGKLKQPSGDERLVAVEVSRSYGGVAEPALFATMYRGLAFEINVIHPAGLYRPATLSRNFVRVKQGSLEKLESLINVYIFPGYADSINPSVFRAKVTSGPKNIIGEIVGTLMPDDTVKLAWQDAGPQESPSPPGRP